ncbi:hypothetical protein LIER_42074 [Lithospermum erythrorhizon]|uniref:Uncharacterized protein n=1 Tax=Lithospermum erythrorhizon TaxID=34254 RepID=A0AAV3RL08_LITER
MMDIDFSRCSTNGIDDDGHGSTNGSDDDGGGVTRINLFAETEDICAPPNIEQNKKLLTFMYFLHGRES